MRLAYASFGVITPVLSVVVSVFMLGLALGTWAGGKGIAALRMHTKLSAAIYYALVEALIAVSAFVVPLEYSTAAGALLTAGELNSFDYLLRSALAITLSIAPWCVLMGATFPFMLAFIKELDSRDNSSFGFLYVANVCGAVLGTLISTFVLIELFGFKQTLMFGAAANIGACLLTLGLWQTVSKRKQTIEFGIENAPTDSASVLASVGTMLFLLFATGAASMAMEVVWTRAYIPVLGNEVYSFAALLAAYLFSTAIGSAIYRADLSRGKTQSVLDRVWLIGLFAILPVVLNDPRVHALMSALPVMITGNEHHLWEYKKVGSLTVLLSVMPLCGLLGYLTPKMIDEISKGRPEKVGGAYGLNIAGCISGPLIASYALLPALGPRLAMIVLAAPFVIYGFVRLPKLDDKQRLVTVFATVIVLLPSIFVSIGYDDFISKYFNNARLIRDYTATTIAVNDGAKSTLIVNGSQMTSLDQCTKDMAHLPLMLRDKKPESALVICLGMGTSFRSLTTWGIKTTAIELVKGVRDSFPIFWPDAEKVLQRKGAQIVVDDGRRYLRRSGEKYDLITVDAPPPVQASGVSLLLSTEFCSLVKDHLTPDGVFQSFIPATDKVTVNGAVTAIAKTFPHVIVIDSPEARAVHCIASMQPLKWPDAATVRSRLTDGAFADLFEWKERPEVTKTLEEYLERARKRQIQVSDMQNPNQDLITDDHPLNEYFLLRKMQGAR